MKITNGSALLLLLFMLLLTAVVVNAQSPPRPKKQPTDIRSQHPFGTLPFRRVNPAGTRMGTKPQSVTRAAGVADQLPAVGLPPVSSTTTAVPASGTAQTQPVNSPALLTNPAGYLFHRLLGDAGQTKRTANAGLMGSISTSGNLTVGVTIRRPITYYSLGVGIYSTRLAAGQIARDLQMTVGAGLRSGKKVYPGVNIAVVNKSTPTGYVQTIGSFDLLTRRKLSVGYGVSVTYLLRSHVWITASLNSLTGSSIGTSVFL